ncbi:thiamine phosphate synthase [Chryseobacterium arthrosphaerae]|uniref:thiamine phosphate synthase n=1 Tax=Chryseobacterium arthrosphaerae TaxID=651561 RepID=UPI001F4A37D2|nr:thiamine phosphate synthase [Chryseobacterium arthrosphaerae]
MILVITPEIMIPNETEIINQMFQKGLDLLHIRKPHTTRQELSGFISEVDLSFRSRLVLHTHYELGEDYGIARFHVREKDRLEGEYTSFADKHIISTSVHDINTYNTLGKEWEYAFISPFFPSISKKGYGENATIIEEVKHRDNKEVKLIALGGITPENIYEVFEAGADGAALLGSVWESEDPLKVFMKCRENSFIIKK